MIIYTYLLFVFIFIKSCYTCIINGEIEGKCISKSALESEIPFCYNYLHKEICVPYLHELWPEFTNKSIDQAIEKKVVKSIEQEFLFELKGNIYSLSLINNSGCMNSYINFLCQKNFMTCDKGNNMNKETCQSNCKRFIDECGTWKTFCSELKNCP